MYGVCSRAAGADRASYAKQLLCHGAHAADDQIVVPQKQPTAFHELHIQPTEDGTELLCRIVHKIGSGEVAVVQAQE